jgi:hypothetical protein
MVITSTFVTILAVPFTTAAPPGTCAKTGAETIKNADARAVAKGSGLNARVAGLFLFLKDRVDRVMA